MIKSVYHWLVKFVFCGDSRQRDSATLSDSHPSSGQCQIGCQHILYRRDIQAMLHGVALYATGNEHINNLFDLISVLAEVC